MQVKNEIWLASRNSDIKLMLIAGDRLEMYNH